MDKSQTRQAIQATISDLVSDFLYYGRKEDPQLPVGAIEEAVETGVFTREEIIAEFIIHLTNGLK